MTVVYFAENDPRFYGVTFQNKGCIKVQKVENVSDDENFWKCF